jgi:hypothetical protein
MFDANASESRHKKHRKRKKSGDEEVQHGSVLKKIRVSSMLLASQSPVFKALLTNGMQETNEKHIRVQVVWR